MDVPGRRWREVAATSLQMRARLSSASDRRPSLAASRAGPERKLNNIPRRASNDYILVKILINFVDPSAFDWIRITIPLVRPTWI